MPGDCWYCGLEHGHPTCDYPACSNKVHGHGPEGKILPAYCPSCRGGEARA